MKYIIIGLGNFGASLAQKLTGLGHEVIGVDNQMSKVEALKEKIEQDRRFKKGPGSSGRRLFRDHAQKRRDHGFIWKNDGHTAAFTGVKFLFKENAEASALFFFPDLMLVCTIIQ